MKRAHGAVGLTLIELLVVCLIILVIGTGLLTLVRTTYQSRDVIGGENVTYAAARQALDVLADHLRNAQSPPGTTAVLVSAGPSSLVYYASGSDSSSTVQYALVPSSHALQRTDSGGSVSTVLTGVQSLQYTYYLNNGVFYTSTTSSPNNWATTATPTAPTSGELPNVAAVDITATINIGGYTRTLETFVRLRNSPPAKKKV